MAALACYERNISSQRAEVVLETTPVSLLKQRSEAFFLYVRSLLAKECGKRTGEL